MATRSEVKLYLAYWFQLGKRIITGDGTALEQPATILQGDRFSAAFEDCWETVLAAHGKGFYLEGTSQNIAELFTPAWCITSCARCDMPIPIREIGLELELCPCHDLPHWPNEDIPKPHAPINNHKRLANMKERIEARLGPQ